MSLRSTKDHIWPAIAATATAGVVTGALFFGSFVDTRSFLTHVDKNETQLIQQHFPVWWPNGRDLMVPLLSSSVLAHGAAYFQTSNKNWAIAGTIVGMILPYTVIALGEDISTLLKAEAAEVAETTRRFCHRHHVRTVMAMAAFGLSLYTLAEL